MASQEADMPQTKCKQSREEANRAQNTLQKEVTSMREVNRTLQLKLRDIEVANDDYERQARNTTTSLEDLESKFNVATERAILLEEEIRVGEQERENLRIETQRLRDELSDLRVESDILAGKLRVSEDALQQSASRRRMPLHAKPARPRSNYSEISVGAGRSADTPNPTLAAGDTKTPPSPPLSDVTTIAQAVKPRRVSGPGAKLLSSSRVSSSTSATAALRKSHISDAGGPEIVPRSESLSQIKGLIGRMQRIEQRVNKARERLPATIREGDSPKASPSPEKTRVVPRCGLEKQAAAMPAKPPTTTASLHLNTKRENIPSGVTVRSPRKRSGDALSSTGLDEAPESKGEALVSAATTQEDWAELDMTSPVEVRTPIERLAEAKYAASDVQGSPIPSKHVLGVVDQTSQQAQIGSPDPRPSSRTSNGPRCDEEKVMRSVSEGTRHASENASPLRRALVGDARASIPAGGRQVSSTSRHSSINRSKTAMTPPIKTRNSASRSSTSTRTSATGSTEASSRKISTGGSRSHLGAQPTGTPAARARASVGATAAVTRATTPHRHGASMSLDITQAYSPPPGLPSTPIMQRGPLERTSIPTPSGIKSGKTLSLVERQAAAQGGQTQSRQNENQPGALRSAPGIGFTLRKQQSGLSMTPTARRVSTVSEHRGLASTRATGVFVGGEDIDEMF